MAYKIIRDNCNDEQVGHEIVAILDSAADLAALSELKVPVCGRPYAAPGSLAIVADSGLPTYVLNASGEWKET